MSLHKPNNDPHLRRAMVGAILAVAIGFWALLAVGVSLKTVLRGRAHSVYPVFAAGSQHWWADKPLYANYVKSEHIDGYRYSPTFAVAFTPFSVLPDRVGAILWTFVSIGLLVWALHVLVRDVLPGDWPSWREGVLLTFSLPGLAVGIWSGQSNAIVTALIILGLAAIVREQWWPACWLLAAPVFIKLWPIAIVLLLMVFRPRKLIWRFVVVGVVLALIPFLTRPPNIVAWQYHEWYLGLTGPLLGRWPGYRDAWTIWEQLCPPVHQHVYLALQLASAVAVFGWCLWQRRRVQSTGHLLTLIFSMWVAWQLLFGPGTEQLTYGIIAPSASWAVLVSMAEKKARWLTWTALLALTYLPAHDVEKVVLRVFPAGMILLPISVVLFVVWLVWHERGKVDSISPQRV